MDVMQPVIQTNIHLEKNEEKFIGKFLHFRSTNIPLQGRIWLWFLQKYGWVREQCNLVGIMDNNLSLNTAENYNPKQFLDNWAHQHSHRKKMQKTYPKLLLKLANFWLGSWWLSFSR